MNMTVSRWAAAFAVVALSASLGACSASSPAGDSAQPLIIAAPLGLTGSSASVAKEVQQGAELALAQIDADGGIAGKQVELRVQDTTGDAAQTVQIVTTFAKDPNVVAVLGPINAAEVGAVTGIAESQGIVLLAPVSAGAVPGVDDLKFNDWTFRLNQAIPLTVGPQIDQVIDAVDARSISILSYDDVAAWKDMGDRWEASAADAGVTVKRIQFPSATQDYSSIVTSIPASSDVIAIAVAPASYGPLIRAIRQAGLTGALVGDSGIFAEEVTDVSRGANAGAYSYSSYLPGSTPAVTAFEDAYEDSYGRAPTAFAAYAYDAIKLMAHAVGDGELTRDAIRKGLSATSGYEGITGTISYDGSGDAQRDSVYLVQVTDDGGLDPVGDIKPLDHL